MVELICRSNFSLLHGASHPEELVSEAARLGIRHLGITDRDAVYGLPRAHRAARESGIHLICGATISVVADVGESVGEGAARLPPITLLAESGVGWRSLCRLLTHARSNTEKGSAEASLHAIALHSEGLFAVFHAGWRSQELGPLREAFAHRSHVALSFHHTCWDRARAQASQRLSLDIEAPLIATNDVLYHRPERRHLADVLTAIRRGVPIEQLGTYLHSNSERALLSPEAFRRRFRDVDGAVEHAIALAERCNFSLDSLCYGYPREVVPEGRTPMDWLAELAHLGLRERYPVAIPEKVQAQVAHELELIRDLDFSSYFLTVHDIVQFARSRGILCQGRGSAANSAVCYALGITSVDPARSSLLFERFISRERAEPPDIDVDFEHERREEVIQYVYGRYGRDRAALVNEVIAYRRRSSLRDVGKAFGLSLDQVDRLARSMDRWTVGVGPVSDDDLVREAGLHPDDRGVRQTLRYASELEGFPRHLSVHVGGFVIAADSLVDLVPIEPAAMADRTVIQWDKDDVDTLGFVKVDLLALGMLTAIRKAFELIRLHWGTDLSLATVPAEDPAVYTMFQRADTVGVFQIESRAQMSMLPRLRPSCFYDLVIEVAIVRPGPIQGGMVHPYLRRKRGEEPVSYAHPALHPILERTLGIPLFQEQVMQIAVSVGGFSPGEADNLRRSMGKWSKRGGLDVIGRRLVQGMTERGIAPAYAEAIYSQLLGFGEYGFPESHAASFALLVYVSGWLKCRYPAAFTAALINSQPMGFYSPRALLDDVRRHGVEVRPVSVVHSAWDCTLERLETEESLETKERSETKESTKKVESPSLRVGLRLISGLGHAEVERLIQARQQAPFVDIADLAMRSRLNPSTLRLLAESGALEPLEKGRREAAWKLQGLWTQMPLFAALGRREPAPSLPVASDLDRICTDYRTLGFSLEGHPVGWMRPGLDSLGVRRLADVRLSSKQTQVRVVGLVSCRQRPSTANGVVFMTLEDESGMLNLVIWPKVWEEFRSMARDAVLLGADGWVQREDVAGGTPRAADGSSVAPASPVSVLVERFWLPDEAPPVTAVSRDFQ